MPAESISTHRRYAVREAVRLRKRDGTLAEGLLIELSVEGCRISNLAAAEFAQDEPVQVEWATSELAGQVRWTRHGVAGIKLTAPLLFRQLADLLDNSGQRRAAA